MKLKPAKNRFEGESISKAEKWFRQSSPCWVRMRDCSDPQYPHKVHVVLCLCDNRTGATETGESRIFWTPRPTETASWRLSKKPCPKKWNRDQEWKTRHPTSEPSCTCEGKGSSILNGSCLLSKDVCRFLVPGKLNFSSSLIPWVWDTKCQDRPQMAHIVCLCLLVEVKGLIPHSHI